ncbi:alpha/beta-hydrolase [Hortaea werneckii]|nr:alpha/beta-hydrolase [Hortaea werneckii]KAI7034202.1 alpha/beta-hydrolase [Hortaea werneckii]KAI7071274.1 alpha/beta-hydrolase [Hortaea werneckii]KAI7128709.1 alpha/beta-hydrolase [Hortaea werneckii]KAI7368176.1 alpha/beta-hydrolase [Hortaea werneckii]
MSVDRAAFCSAPSFILSTRSLQQRGVRNPMRLVAHIGASLLALPATLRSAAFATALHPVDIPSAPTVSTPLPHSRPTAAYSTMTSTSSADDASREGGQRPMLARQRSKEEAEAQGRQPPRGGYFPLSYKEGWSQWWAGLTPAMTEHKVLSFLPYLKKPPTQMQSGTTPPDEKQPMDVDQSKAKEAAPVRTTSETDPHGPRQWHSNLVQLAGKNRFLNEFSVERLGEETENNLVMLHGYGAGLGFYYKNFEPLSRLPSWKLYALDLLGMGRSSRPPFKINAKDKEGKVREAESWFIDALEEWRIKKGIEKMTLLGHSLGGYMAVCYALKYPGHLNKLILASPVGIPEDPYAVNDEMPESGDTSTAAEFEQAELEGGGPAGDNNNFLNARKRQEEASRDGKPAPRKPLPKWLTTLWDANISPFSLVRLSGPLGPRLVSGWTSRRFSHLPPDEAQALHDYSYSLFRQRGSGEYALAYILAPGAFARSPLIRRIHGVGRQYLEDHKKPEPDAAASTPPTDSPQKVRETGVPIVLMYGDHDWMDVGGGYASKERLEAEKQKALANATEREKQMENGSVKVSVVPKAGHHVYLDGTGLLASQIRTIASATPTGHGRLQGRVAIVTGAASGLGRAIAFRYSAEGASVICADIRETSKYGASEEETRGTTHDRINEAGGQAVFVSTDVTNPVSMENLVERAVEGFGKVDVFVNNAGVALESTNPQPVWEMPLEMWEKEQMINSTGVFLGTNQTELAFGDEKRRAQLQGKHPFRGLGQPDDIARACVFLASDDAQWVSGVYLPVDGCYTAR